MDKNARKGKLPERVGRKATGLKPGDGKAAGLPGGNPLSQEALTRRWAALLLSASRSVSDESQRRCCSEWVANQYK